MRDFLVLLGRFAICFAIGLVVAVLLLDPPELDFPEIDRTPTCVAWYAGDPSVAVFHPPRPADECF